MTGNPGSAAAVHRAGNYSCLAGYKEATPLAKEIGKKIGGKKINWFPSFHLFAPMFLP